MDVDKIAGLLFTVAAIVVASISPAHADGNLGNVNHIVIIMQENHSFDNYLGALPYVPGGPYHPGPCRRSDHSCVDGLSACVADPSGRLAICSNSNVDDDGSIVFSFHEPRYCTGPDLQHNWPGSHLEANFLNPNHAVRKSTNDGFVRVNDASEQTDAGGESATEDDTMGFYTQDDLPFYYGLAQAFAIDDRYFCSVIGPTFPNRSYGFAATSFGHLTTDEIFPPLLPKPGGYMPITGTILDLLDGFGVSWINYFIDVPSSGIFRPFLSPHVAPVSAFYAQAAIPNGLPAVSFVDPAFVFDENDEHPPTDIRKGEVYVSSIVNAVRNGPNWKDSIIFITYDEHGGFYDHVPPPRAPQGFALSPDGINPGQCADLSAPPASTQRGGGARCAGSRRDARALCPGFTRTGPYPATCANFNQLGFRVPFIAVSPFSKPGYVSHRVGDHTSMLALIEKRFFGASAGRQARPHLTARDLHADTLEDIFDFDHSPSLNTPVPIAPPVSPSDPGCPFVP